MKHERRFTQRVSPCCIPVIASCTFGLADVRTCPLLPPRTSLYARDSVSAPVQSHERTLFTPAQRLLLPRSPPGAQELPHLLEQESEGLWYVFAVAFRLLGVRWPQPSRSGSSGAGAGADAGGGGGAAAAAATAAAAAAEDETADGGAAFDDDGSVSLMPWPERRSFELEAAVAPDDGARGGEAGGRYRQINHHHQHQQHNHQHQLLQSRRLRPPRPGSAEVGEAGGVAGGRSARGGSGVGGNGSGSRSSLPGPMLVVDDLLEWSGEGDEGPAGGGTAGEGGVGVDWDGTALGFEFLRSEGRALLERYFIADGEVQRTRWVVVTRGVVGREEACELRV